MLTLSDLDVELAILDSSLPLPSSPISPEISRHESTGESLCKLCPANGSLKYPDNHLMPPLRSEDPSFPPSQPPRVFSSEGNSADSMDWPSIGSSLFFVDRNARQDGILERLRRNSPENCFSRAEVADPAFPGPLISDDAEVTQSSQHDSSVSDASMASLHLPPLPRIFDLPMPVFPRIALPPLVFPSERHPASSIPRNDYGDTKIGGAVPDPFLARLLSSARGDCRDHGGRSTRFNLAGAGGVTSSLTSSRIFDHCVPGDFGKRVRSSIIAAFANFNLSSRQLREGCFRMEGPRFRGPFVQVIGRLPNEHTCGV